MSETFNCSRKIIFIRLDFEFKKDITDRFSEESIVNKDDEEPPDSITEKTIQLAEKDIEKLISCLGFCDDYPIRDYGEPENY